MSLNPTKISGICGRLMCCLKYEHETYEAARKYMPKVGALVDTPKEGEVVESNILLEMVKVKLELWRVISVIKDFSIKDIVELRPKDVEHVNIEDDINLEFLEDS